MKKKINTNNKYVAVGLTAFITASAIMLLFFCIYRWNYIIKIFNRLISILMPFIYGLVIAYLVNPMITFFDKKVFRKLLKKFGVKRDIIKSSRALALLTSTIIFIGCLVTLFNFFIPELVNSVDMFIENAKSYLDNSRDLLNDIFGNSSSIKELINNHYDKISTYFVDWLQDGYLQEIISAAGNSIFGTLKFLYNVVIGLIISIYLLYDKEKFIAQTRKIMYSFLNPKQIEIFSENLKHTDKIFGNFFTAKIIDSLIIGILCFIGMLIFRIPYATVIAVIVGITNIIPYFGPFIGAIPSCLLIFLVSPSKCITFIIFIFILQQFDGNILGPRIMGGKTGLGSFWVLCSLLIFGGFFGVLGMIIGVPIFSIIYSFVDNFLRRRLKDKNMPLDSNDYMNPKYIQKRALDNEK